MPSRPVPTTIRRPTPPAGTRVMRGRAYADGNFRPVRIALVSPGVRANVRRAPSMRPSHHSNLSLSVSLSLPLSGKRLRAPKKSEGPSRSLGAADAVFPSCSRCARAGQDRAGLAHISMWMCVYLRLIGSSSSLLSATSPDKMRLINSSAATRARCVLAASVPIRVRQDAAGDERRGPATH